MNVAHVKIKVKTITKQVTVGGEEFTSTEFQTKIDEVRGYSHFDVKGDFLIFYNADVVGNHISYNQEHVVDLITITE